MARTTQTAAAFDVNAYLAAKAEPRRSLLTVIGDATEQVAARVSYRAGKATDSMSGNLEVFELGQKVGAIEAGKRVDSFRQRAKAEIEALLAQ